MAIEAVGDRTLDRLIYFFAHSDAVFDDRDVAAVMAIWFEYGLEVAMAHPEWARAVVAEGNLDHGLTETLGGPIREDALERHHEDVGRVVAAVPMIISDEEADRG